MNPDKMSERELRQEVKRLRGALGKANARERPAFENGAAMLANEVGVSFGTTAKVDLEMLWQQYRCQDDTDWACVQANED